MRSLSGLGVGLSLVFGCLLMALAAEVYYLFWWKKRTALRDMEGDHEDSSSAGELFLYFCCWRKKPSLLGSRALIPQELSSTIRAAEEGEDGQHQALSGDEDGMEVELMELHNLYGSARFLFTIKEETKEDMESEDGRSRGDESRKGSRRRCMGDVLLNGAGTPFFTPLSSPPFFTPPLTPMGCCSPHGFSPLSEPPKENDPRRFGLGSSPPPKFKFLKDAEEKLYRKTLLEEATRVHRSLGVAGETSSSFASAAAPPVASPSSVIGSEEEEGSFITIAIGRSQERGRHQHHASSSQVIPLPSSPSNGGGNAQGKTQFLLDS